MQNNKRRDPVWEPQLHFKHWELLVWMKQQCYSISLWVLVVQIVHPEKKWSLSLISWHDQKVGWFVLTC
jgi:hypothetical protein